MITDGEETLLEQPAFGEKNILEVGEPPKVLG